MAQARVRYNRDEERRMFDQVLPPFLTQRVGIPAVRYAKRFANVDTGNLRALIGFRLDRTSDGSWTLWLESLANYALWQETVPGDAIPGVGTRQRAGGRPHLRPALMQVRAELR